MSELRTGAQILCEALVREGAEVLFGIPGGAIMPFCHALPEYQDSCAPASSTPLNAAITVSERRVVDNASRAAMKEALGEVRSGAFARAWIAEADGGAAAFQERREEEGAHPIEVVGNRLREHMAWL